jgi:Ca2+-binding EF-hand superfamily protein
MGEPFFGRTAGEDGLVVWFQQADRNHDGALTVEEMTADADRFFQTLDRNHDGEIDPDEISYYEGVIAPELRVQPILSSTTLPGGDVEEHADDESSAGRLGLLQIPEPVASADSNFNRGVSPEEFRNAAVARFQLLDTSHSGKLTLPQLENIRHAASTVAKRRRDIKPGASDDPSSAEYGTPPTPQ